MNRQRTLILAAVLLVGLMLATGVMAQGMASVDWWVVAGGGGEASDTGNVIVNSTLGQPIIGSSSGNSVALGAGYWYGAEEPNAVTLFAFTAARRGNNVVVAWLVGSAVLAVAGLVVAWSTKHRR